MRAKKTITAYRHKTDEAYGPAVDRPGADFYVTVRDAGRTGWLLGPYATHQVALDNVQRGRDLANEWNAKAWFMAFGTASVPTGTPIQTVFQQDGTVNSARTKR